MLWKALGQVFGRKMVKNGGNAREIATDRPLQIVCGLLEGQALASKRTGHRGTLLIGRRPLFFGFSVLFSFPLRAVSGRLIDSFVCGHSAGLFCSVPQIEGRPSSFCATRFASPKRRPNKRPPRAHLALDFGRRSLGASLHYKSRHLGQISANR